MIYLCEKRKFIMKSKIFAFFINILNSLWLFFCPNCKRVVCFHSLSKRTLNPQIFQQFIQLLHQKNFKIVGLDEILQEDKKGKYISLTFDDGYSDNLKVLLPILKSYDITASIFVVTGLMGKKSSDEELVRCDMQPADTISENEIKKWVKEDMGIGFHTNKHIDLSKSNNQKIEIDFEQGNKTLEKIVGGKIRYFAYPFGNLPKDKIFFDRLLKRNGYRYAFTTNWGGVDTKSPFYINRVALGDNDPPAIMLAKTIGVLDLYFLIKKKFIKNQRTI